MNTSQDWQSLYRVALLENDWTKMEELVRAAEMAIIERKRQFSLDHGGLLRRTSHSKTRCVVLMSLRKEALQWSGSKPVGTNCVQFKERKE